jgi:hypothetical protein
VSSPGEAFIDMLIACMTMAAKEKKLTQLQTTISPDGTRKNMKVVRIIIVPEDMDETFPIDQPLGTDPSKQ